MSGGFVKISRRLPEHPLWLKEPFTRGQAWVDLILLANWKPSYFYIRGLKVNVSRGQLAYSSGTLSERWKWSKGKVLRFLNDMQAEGQIELQKNNVTTLITITNYEEYQTKRNAERDADGEAGELPSGTADGYADGLHKKKLRSKEVKKGCFTPPTIEEVRTYCNERGNSVNPQNFIDHYQANGWMRGKTKIKDWKACVRTWEKNQPRENKPYVQ